MSLDSILISREIDISPKIDLVLLKRGQVQKDRIYKINNWLYWILEYIETDIQDLIMGYYVRVIISNINESYYLYFNYSTRMYHWIEKEPPIKIVNSLLFSEYLGVPADKTTQLIINKNKHRYLDFKRGNSKTYEWTMRKWFHHQIGDYFIEYRIVSQSIKGSFIVECIINPIDEKESREQSVFLWESQRGLATIVKGNISDLTHQLVSTLFLKPTQVEFK